MTTTLTAPAVASAPQAPGRRRRIPHKGAIAFLIVPFGVLFVLFYVVPIAYAF